MDQISYILETNGADINLLSQLNKLSRAFPSKSSATATGLLYIDYNKKISAANAVIETGTQVYRKVMINSKVVDEREGEESSWTEHIYAESDAVSRTETSYDGGFISNMVLARTQIEVSEGDAFNNYGYVFFDYDKAVFETAVLGAYFNLETIYKIIGQSVLNNYFKLTSATYTRALYTLGTDDLIEIGGTFDNGYEIKNVTWHDVGLEESIAEDHAEPYVTDSYGYMAYSFVLLRNFELTQEEGWDGYRMMCFEIQDFEDATGEAIGGVDVSGQWEYSQMKFEAIVEDNTGQLAIDLIIEYQKLYSEDTGDGGDEATPGGFNEYYIDATDVANYSSEEKWTESFQALMHDIYDDDEGNAPWILYPTYYCVFLDLAIDEFDADSDKIADEVNRIASKINPYNGSLEELESFYESFKALGESGGVLATIYEELDPTDDVVSSIEKAFYNSFGDEAEGGSFEQDVVVDPSSLVSTAAYAVSTTTRTGDSRLPTIEASAYTPSDSEEGVSYHKSDTKPKASYADYGKNSGTTVESLGFFLGGVSMIKTYASDDMGQLTGGDDITEYFKLEYNAGPSWEGGIYLPWDIIKKVVVRWSSFTLSFVMILSSDLEPETEYRWSFANSDDASLMITDEHLTPVADFEINFKTSESSES